MTTITLKGREIPLLYTVYEMKLIQEEIGPLDSFSYMIFGRNKDNEEDQSGFGKPEHLNAVAKLVAILGNAGLEESGGSPDLTAKKVLRSMKPVQFSEIVSACMQAMHEGMESEIEDERANEPKDVILEELERKKEATS